MALIEYRESLEERGLKKEEIEKKVTAHQKQLQYKYGLMDSSENTSHNSELLKLDVFLLSYYIYLWYI